MSLIEKTGNDRNDMVDILRGIGIYLSVLGHSISYGSGAIYKTSVSFLNCGLYTVIYTFHMPLLALISGVMFYFSLRRSKPIKVILRKLTYILIPLFAWGIPTAAVYYFFVPSIAPHSLIELIKFCINSYWFFKIILIASIITTVVFVLSKDRYWAFILATVLFLFIPESVFGYGFWYTYLFFTIGYIVAKCVVSGPLMAVAKRTVFPFCAVLIASVVFALLIGWYAREGSSSNGIELYSFSLLGVSDVLSRLEFIVHRVAVALSAIIILYYTVKLICWKLPKVLSVFKYIGRETFGIYIVSAYIFDWVLQKLTRDFSHNIIINLIESVIITAICYFITLVGKKIPLVNSLFFGVRWKQKKKETEEVTLNNQA